MDVIRVRAPSAAHAQRLVTSLAGGFSATVDGGSPSDEVELRLDSETATKLVELFDALGLWLSDGKVEACQIGFGARTYTLLAARAGEANDPTQFLLERTIQLQTALDSRIVLEQAKGILAERESITPTEAFSRLRREARSKRMKLHDLAADIVATASNPADQLQS
jgi:ANTAR domain